MIDVATYSVKVLWIFGLYYGKRLPKYAFFELTRAVTLTFILIFPTLILVKILSSDIELAVTIRLIFVFCFVTAMVCSTFLHVGTLGKMRAFEELIENDVFNMQSALQDRFISAAGAKQRYFIRYYWPIVAISGLFFVIYPIVTTQFFNVPIWTPLNDRVEDTAIYIYESCFVLGMACIFPALSSILIGFTASVTVQLEILKDNLEHATDRNSHEDYAKQERRIQERLKRCIIHHNAILE